MTRTEKMISAVSAITVGILLIVLKGDVLKVLNAVVGIVLIVLGIFDFIRRENVFGTIKCVVGGIVLAFGWFILSAILYIFAALTVLGGVCWLYEVIRQGCRTQWEWRALIEYIKPVVCILIGLFLFFNQNGAADWVFIFCGVGTVLEGAFLLLGILASE